MSGFAQNNFNVAIPTSPTTDSPYDVLRHGDYFFTTKSVDLTAATPITAFTVTGVVRIAVIGIVTATATTSDAITAEVGVSGDTAKLIAQVADATGLAQNEIWHDASPDATIEAASVWNEWIVTNGQDVIVTTTGTFTEGDVDLICRWYPMSSDGNVVAA